MKASKSVRFARVWLRLTQEEFAAACGVSRGTVTRWEAGTAPPPAWLHDVLAFKRRAWEAIDRAPENHRFTITVAQIACRDSVLAAIRLWRESRRRPTQALHPRYALLRSLVELPVDGEPDTVSSARQA